jgi:hypothetical protein
MELKELKGVKEVQKVKELKEVIKVKVVKQVKETHYFSATHVTPLPNQHLNINIEGILEIFELLRLGIVDRIFSFNSFLFTF